MFLKPDVSGSFTDLLQTPLFQLNMVGIVVSAETSMPGLDDTNINYNLRNIETYLALPRPYRNFLKRSFKFSGAQCSGRIFQTQTCLLVLHAFY